MFKKCLLILVSSAFLSSCASSYKGQGFLGTFYEKLFGHPDVVEVKKGDTLYSIAKRYDMSISELIELNKIDSPDQLYVGQVLRTTSNRFYTVKKGDTLASIARRYNTSYQNLAKRNNIRPPYELKVGQKISVSNNTSSKPAVSAKTSYKSANSFGKQAIKKASTASTSYVSTKRNAKFVWPVNGKIISSFGAIGKGRKNDGINISAASGTAVKAGDKGVVAYAGNGLKGFGNLILIKHTDGYITAYAHNDKLLVKKGQTVLRGEKIATVGKTGGVTTPQLHFEVRAGKKAVNPKNYLP